MNNFEGYMTNAKGALIPVDNIKPEHLLEDELVTALIAKAMELSGDILDFKRLAFGEINDFRGLIAQKYGVEKGGKKGNLTLTSFDGKNIVQIAISDTLSFGAELEAAKDLIDKCIKNWSEGANANLKTIVNDAFQVNKQGRIDTQRVLGLRHLDIKDEEWKAAMEALSDALRVTSTREYIRFYQVDPDSGVKRAIPLDIAQV